MRSSSASAYGTSWSSGMARPRARAASYAFVTEVATSRRQCLLAVGYLVRGIGGERPEPIVERAADRRRGLGFPEGRQRLHAVIERRREDGQVALVVAHPDRFVERRARSADVAGIRAHQCLDGQHDRIHHRVRAGADESDALVEHRFGMWRVGAPPFECAHEQGVRQRCRVSRRLGQEQRLGAAGAARFRGVGRSHELHAAVPGDEQRFREDRQVVVGGWVGVEGGQAFVERGQCRVVTPMDRLHVRELDVRGRLGEARPRLS